MKKGDISSDNKELHDKYVGFWYRFTAKNPESEKTRENFLKF